jgi:hypothetical protein
VTLNMPGSLAVHLEDATFYEQAEREAYDGGRRISRGRHGFSLQITAPIPVHRAFLDRCWVLEGGENIDTSPGERAAYRMYKRRIETAEANASTDKAVAEPGRLAPIDGVSVGDLDPESLMGDGVLLGGSDPDSLHHDNCIHAASGLRVLRAHGSPADNVDQALTDVLVDLLHLGDLLGVDPDWVSDAREHHRKEITGDY